MNPSRETILTAIFNALVTLVNNPSINMTLFQATARNSPTTQKPLEGVSRRVRAFNDSGPKPCIYIGEFGNQYKWQSESLGTIVLEPALFIYTDIASDPNSVPSVQMNTILDAIDLAFKPDDANGKCTLGGLVSSVRSMGEVPIAPGDLGGPGIAVVPLNILVANGDLS